MPRVVAHRGRLGEDFENVTAGLKTLRGKTDTVEVDVRVSRDGVPVLIHDPGTGRVADRDLVVRDSDFEELRSLVLFGQYRMPSLKHWLKSCQASGVTTVLLDIKTRKKAEIAKILKVASRHQGNFRLFLLVKRPSLVPWLKEKAADSVSVGLLRVTRSNVGEVIETLTGQADMVFIKNTDEGYLENREAISELRQVGFSVSASLLNRPASYRQAVNDRCSFVLTDRKDAFLAKCK